MNLFKRLSGVSLDFAEEDPDPMNRRALAVEQCQCPPGYAGLSCEVQYSITIFNFIHFFNLSFSLKSCAPGYRRSSGGFYLGLCERDVATTTQRPQVVIRFDVPNNNLNLRPGENHIVYVTVVGVSNLLRKISQNHIG